MNPRTTGLLFSIVMIVVVPTAAEDPAMPDQLADAIAAFYESVDGNDVEARIGLLADDVMLMPNHWTIMAGKESVAASLRRSAAAVFKIRDRRVLSVDVSHDLAVVANSYYYTYHAVGAEEQWHKTKNVHVWRRGFAGDWKLAVDIWNSDVPLELFASE